jgi:hypothetical protein
VYCSIIDKKAIDKNIKGQSFHYFFTDDNVIFLEQIKKYGKVFSYSKLEFHSFKQDKTILCEFVIKKTIETEQDIYYFYYPVL